MGLMKSDSLLTDQELIALRYGTSFHWFVYIVLIVYVYRF